MPHYGVYNSQTKTTIIGNIINTAYAGAVYGLVFYNPYMNTNYYIQYPSTAGNNNYPLQVPAEKIKNGIVSGNITGTFV